LIATRFELNQRACTESALPWRPFLPVLLRVERFTARTIAQVSPEGKATTFTFRRARLLGASIS
jgi:hypothetical protein